MLQPARFTTWAQRKYGDAVYFDSLLGGKFVMIFDPELTKQVFLGKPDQLRAGESNAVLGPVVGRHSVLLLDGKEHLRERRMLLPPFHGERMRAYADEMRAAADRQIDAWPIGRAFPLLPSMRDLTLDVILRTVFGVAGGARMDELAAGIRELLAPNQSRLGVLVFALSQGRAGAAANRGFEQARDAVDAMLYAEIAERRDAADLEEREDILSMLLLARDEDGEPLTDLELRDELVTLLVAGHETTSAGLAWTFELLGRNPAVLARLKDSLAAGESEYLDAVVKEALRARPVISGVGRVVRGEPFELGQWTLPVGMEVNPYIAGIHRRADRYPEPNAFRPERFLGEDGPDTYTWLPFGGGTRRCLGASFALFEMAAVVRRVLERVELEPASSRPERGVRRAITFVPEKGARVVARSVTPLPTSPEPAHA
jgi:cytochrome P450